MLNDKGKESRKRETSINQGLYNTYPYSLGGDPNWMQNEGTSGRQVIDLMGNVAVINHLHENGRNGEFSEYKILRQHEEIAYASA